LIRNSERNERSIGSASNIDQDSTRSRIVRFDMVDATLPLNYADKAFVFADGTRNEVGLRMDKFGRLWGVEVPLARVCQKKRTD
jgi:glucose/arabinose dehydrogenase